jgi:hypothetical protein
MKTIVYFLLMFSVPVIVGCGGRTLPVGGNVQGSILYGDTGDSVESGTAIFDNGTNSYRAEIKNGSFETSIPAGDYKVWFENIAPLQLQADYLSQEKTPINTVVLGKQQNIPLIVQSDKKAKKR